MKPYKSKKFGKKSFDKPKFDRTEKSFDRPRSDRQESFRSDRDEKPRDNRYGRDERPREDRFESRGDRHESSPRTFDRPSGRYKPAYRTEDRSERREFDETSSGFKLFHAVCDRCGRECDVPFKPTGSKPIYCRSCFRELGNNPDRPKFDKFDDKFESNASSVSAEDLEKINKKLDKIMKALKIE